jgi:hypothetical protein
MLVALVVILCGGLYSHDRGSASGTGPGVPAAGSAPPAASSSPPAASSSPPVASSSAPVAAEPAGRVPAGTLDPAAAVAALGGLRVAPKGDLAGYDRSCGAGDGCVFGPAWADVDHDGCDQRNDVLHRDLTAIEVRPGTHGCVVIAGTLADPYTGTTVPFAKARAGELQIDHVVPLAAAWTQGAAAWSGRQREAFANDLGNLVATEAGPNESKGDATADEWVPPDRGYGCAYARIVVTVKQRYGLSVTSTEAGALRGLLAGC